MSKSLECKMKPHRNTEGDLAAMAYVRGWRQNNDGRWFKPGVAGTFNSASDAFKTDARKDRGAMGFEVIDAL